jgi:CRP-like cAMP-binding protein
MIQPSNTPTEARDDCLERMLQRFSRLTGSDAAEIAVVERYVSPATFEANAHLLEAGDIADSVFYLCSGLVRFYYLAQDGKEHNKSFVTEGQFAGALQLSNDPRPSRFYIQALEPVQALAISLDALNRLYAQSLAWANIGRLYMESIAVRKARREAQFLLDSAEERYCHFLTTQPELAEKLPLYHIASYLGITDVALSRIRRRIRDDPRFRS